MEVSELCAILERLDLDVSCSIKNLLQSGLKGEPVLHAAITLPGENKRRIVKALIEAGADCERRDDRGRTPCECALTVLGDRELASDMIAAELDSLPDDRAFYVMIRRGSLPVFKLFLELRKVGEGKVFELVANAMIELNAKNVKINDVLDAFLQYSLTAYAFTYLRGNATTNKNVTEWRMHFKVIAENWSALRERYLDRDYANIDNEFVHRIQTIHNHVYFVKDKRFLKHLPMMEIVYCLAVFAAIFNQQNHMLIFKWMINKLNIMQFLDVICRQLRKVEQQLNIFEDQLTEMLDCFAKSKGKPSKELLMCCWMNVNPSNELNENIVNKIINCFKKGFDHHTIISEVIANESFKLPYRINRRDRSTLVRLRRCYFRTKQLYSIHKCYLHIHSLSKDSLQSRSDQSSIPAVKRVIQVIGEAIKSTKNSPNVPKKIEAALGQMLSEGFPTTNKYMRELFSHKFSLANRYLLELPEANYLSLIPRWFAQVEMIFLVILMCSTVEASRYLLGSMRRCHSLSQLRSLFQYIGDLKVMIDVQMQLFGKLEDIFEETNNLISSLDIPSNQPKLDILNHGLKVQKLVLFRIRRCLMTEWQISFEDNKVACLGKADLKTIYRMIDWNLTNCDHSEIYDEIKRNWNTNHVTLFDLQAFNTDLIKHNPSVMVGIFKQYEYLLKSIQETECVKHTQHILEDLRHTDPPEELVNTLHVQLSKYYEDIFVVDNKYKTIKTLFKNRQLPIDEECFKRMRRQDEESLQKIFDDRVEAMRKILQTYGLSSMEAWADMCGQIPDQVLLGLEYYQLQLTEILISVGYFGDNFHMLKHSIPLIYGRNYRNCLAHDSLSYSILTNSAHFNVIANALVMVNNPVRIFGKHSKNAEQRFKFATSEHTLKWMEIQTDLANGILRMDYESIRGALNEGAEILGKFCGTIGSFDSLKCDIESIELIDPNCSGQVLDTMMEIFESKSPKSTVHMTSPKYRSWYAFQRGEFAKSVEIATRDQSVRSPTLPQYFYYWEHLLTHLPKEFLDWNKKDQLGRTILHRLVKAGNYDGVAQILLLNPDTDINAMDDNGNTAFDLAIFHGFIQIAKLLSTKNPKLSANNRQFSMVNHLNEFLPQLFAEYDEELLLDETYIMVAIRANNCAALEFIVDQLYRGPHSSLNNQHLASGTTLAAYFNHFQIVEFLLSLPDTDFFTDQSIASGHPALQFAIRKRNWSATKLLLERGASPNWVHPFITLPHRTAFQIAVDAGNCQLLSMMKHIDTQLYDSLKHPLSIAIKNDSTKVIRHLQSLGFTLLDSNRILNTAVKCDSIKYVNQIFQALDASIDEWKRYEGYLGMIGQLLSRWNALIYLEKRECNSITAIMQAIEVDNWTFVSLLLEKSRELRKVNERFIVNIEVYNEKGVIGSIQSSEELNYSCTLLTRLKNCLENNTEKSSIVPIICHTLPDIRVECHRITFSDINPEELDLTSIPSNSNGNEASNCREIVLLAMESVKKSKDIILGTIQENQEVLNYFIVFSEVFCLFQLYQTEPPHLLESLVNTPCDNGETPLHMVSSGHGKVDQMKLLLENGANPIAPNNIGGLTPLHLSLVDLECSKSMLLLNHCIANGLKSSDGTPALEIANGHGCRPIHYAALFKKHPAIQLLLEHGVNVRVEDQLGYHPAMYAARSINPKTLRLFLDYDPDLVNITNVRGETVLHVSAKFEDEACILSLLEYDVDITVADHEGNTAIEKAIGEANTAWVKIVLFYARINGIRGLFDHLYSIGFPPLHYSVVSNKAEIVRAVVEYEIDEDLFSDQTDVSLRKLRELLTTNIEPGRMNALHIAVRQLFKESVEILLFCQARYNQYSNEKIHLAQDALDFKGKTPLDYAIESQDEVMINMLLNSQ